MQDSQGKLQIAANQYQIYIISVSEIALCKRHDYF